MRTVKMWTDDALAELQRCLEATIYTSTQILLAVILTGALQSRIEKTICVFPYQKTWLTRMYAARSGTGMQLSRQGTSWSTGIPAMSSKNPRGHVPKDWRAAIGEIT